MPAVPESKHGHFHHDVTVGRRRFVDGGAVTAAGLRRVRKALV